MSPAFIFATGIENSAPTIQGGTVRVDEMDKCAHYRHWRTDFDLVQKFGYLELDLRRPGQGEELYIPQHPTGAPAMIAVASDRDQAGNCAVDNPAYDGYDTDTDVSYYCDTEGGSSGSPVLSRLTNKVVALHHFGGCPNSGVRMERIFTQIQSLL